MELADVDRLVSSDDRALAQLREALPAAGLDARFLAKLARVGERLDDPMRAPMRVWNARRMPEAAAVLARIFVLHDPVTPAEAARVLGPCEALIDAGLLDSTGGGVTSCAHLAFAGELVVFGDRTAAGDGIPPLNGVTPVLARAALPRGPIDAALDVGCGAGALALVFSTVARRVVATDVNPRALSWTRFNARLNGVDRVEVRLGDRY
ncbi:MAG TPA: methyltransferase, partial [Polyangiaceae bacterium]